MGNTVNNIVYSTNGKLYAGMTKERIRTDINAMTFMSEGEREKAYNKQIEIFNYANSLVESEVDDVISEKEIEAYNNEISKSTWKNIGLTVAGVGITLAGIFFARKLKLPPQLIKSCGFGKNSIEINKKMRVLKQTLGKEYFNKVNWEELIPRGATSEDIKCAIDELSDSAKFFSRLSVCENRYGKNFAWAKKVNTISKKATKKISAGRSQDEVLALIAKDYQSIDTRKTNEIDVVGRLRKDFDPEIPRLKGDRVATPFSKERGIYAEYADRLSKVNILEDCGREKHMARINQCEYSAMIVGGTILSGSVHDITLFRNDIKANYAKLRPLFKKVKNGKNLSRKEIKIAHNIIAELYYRFANFCPYDRGTNGITDIFMRSMYKALNIDMPALKKGVSLDLEAFCMNLDEYKLIWNSFFM